MRANNQRAKLEGRCELLADVVESVGDLYHNEGTTEDQKGCLETIVGAALWHLPVPKECWTEQISVEAIRAHHPESGLQEPKLTKDHEYPRKIAAADLLAKHAAENGEQKDELLLLYENKYGRFNYVTPHENRSLMRHQRREAFEDPETAYRNAGIRLVRVTRVELSGIKARDAHTIAQILERLDS